MTVPNPPQSLDALIERARQGGPIRVAVAGAAQTVVLDTMRQASRMGLAEAHLIGERADIEALLKPMGWDGDAPRIHPSAPDAAAAVRAVAMVRDGEADVVMKGALHTDTFMRVLLDGDSGLRVPGRRVSHMFLLQVRGHDRLIGITDAAINIAPDLTAKAQICQNAVDVFHGLGIAMPKVAVLSAIETVTGSIVSTLDAAGLTLMARRGQIVGALVDGPLALDNAISARAAAEKGIISEVAGRADILLVPDLVTGNVLAKALEYLGGAGSAGVALGLSVPVVLTSRADTKSTRLASLALAALLRTPAAAPTPAEEAHHSLRAAPRAESECCPLPVTGAGT